MKKEKQLKALAVLDGDKPDAEGQYTRPLPYLTSYDAIIPVALKVIGVFEITATTTPASLCERVLRKAGLWEDGE